MTRTGNSQSPYSRETLAIVIAVLMLAVVMTLKYFPGLENEPAYAGIAFQTIHPDAFQGDYYRGPNLATNSTIIQLSAVYGLVKLFGDLWLDDRFLSIIYFSMVAIGLVGVDKTARLLGATGVYERLVILMFFAKDHAVLDHKVLLAHHQDFNHSVFAIPIIVWLFYAAMARKGLPVILALSVLLLSFSVRNAPIPILMAMAVTFFLGSKVEKIWIGVLSLGGILFSYWVLFHFFSIDEASRKALWDILRNAGEGDVNPFHDAFYDVGGFLKANSVWLALLLSAFFLSPTEDTPFKGVRVLMIAGGLTWLIGGLYISFAPDVLKFPLLQGTAPTRALAWPQNIAYIALLVIGFRFIRDRKSLRHTVFVGFGFAILFVIGPGNFGRWTLLLVSAVLVTIGAHYFRCMPTWTGRKPDETFTEHVDQQTSRIMAHSLIIVLVIGYAAALYGKAPAWRTAWNTGVFGDSLPAAWIGIAEYIRKNTASDAVIFPIMYSYRSTYPVVSMPLENSVTSISINRSLGTRSGRAMPVPEDFPGNFRDPKAWQDSVEDQKRIDAIKLNLINRKYCAVALGIESIHPIADYIVLPESLLPEKGTAIGAYQTIYRLNGYAIMHRDRHQESKCPTQ